MVPLRWALLQTIVSAYQITAYDSNHSPIGTGVGTAQQIGDSRFANGLQGAKYYKVGSSSNILTLWHPFNVENGGGDYAGLFLRIGMQLMDDTVDQNNQPTFSFVLKNSGWDGVVGDPICATKDVGDCPDIICLGTTQGAARVVKNEIYSLNTFFQQYAADNGEIFPDNIFQKYYYDFNFKGEWMGIPLQTDARMFYYNRTTFDALGLKHPPPVGNWGANYKDTWTWKAMLDYASTIKKAGYQYGFEFYGGYDEELKFITMVAREYKSTLINDNGKCGFNTTSFKRMIDEILRPLYLGNPPIANTNFESFDSPQVLAWISNTTLGSPLGQPYTCCKSNPQGTESMTLSYMVFANTRLFDAVTNPKGDIGRAYVPGKATFLGGNGLMITASSKQKDLAWRFLQLATNTANAVTINLYSSTLPPYYTAAKVFSANIGSFQIVRDQYDSAVPVQYPQGSFPQFGELETRKPFRLFLMELLFKNLSNDVLADRLCTVINYALLPTCDSTHMDLVDSGCNPLTMERNLLYQWSPVRTCKDGIALLKPLPLNCPYVPNTSSLASAMTAISVIAIVVGLAMIGGLVYFRNEKAVKKSSYILSCVVIFGAVLCAASVPLFSGEPAQKTCGGEFFMLGYGVALAIGALCMKMWRLTKIFGAKTKIKMKLTDKYMLIGVGCFVVAQTALLLFWYFVQQPAYIVDQKMLSGTTISYVNNACGYRGQQVSLVGLALNVLLVCYVVYLAVIGRKIPSEYNDGRLIGIIIYTIAFLLIVVLPANAFIADPIVQYTITCGAILFGSLATSLIYALPKIYNAYKKVEVESTFTGKDSSSSGLATTCPHCHKTIYTGVDKSKPTEIASPKPTTELALDKPR